MGRSLQGTVSRREAEAVKTQFVFEVGQLIQHKRYGYRGAIAGRDDRCRASDEWYHSNQTTPAREQAWYHVLVHGGRHTTYVAEENLELDQGGEQIVHPLTKMLFEYFHKGRYAPRPGVSFPSWEWETEER